jgi:hypothetical protein
MKYMRKTAEYIWTDYKTYTQTAKETTTAGATTNIAIAAAATATATNALFQP